MQKVERLLIGCTRTFVPGSTVRRMVGFKNRRTYNRCVKELAKRGIRPVKTIRGGFIIACHLNPRQLKQLTSLINHLDVKFVEQDLKIRMHALRQPKSPFISSASSAKSRTRGMPFLNPVVLRPLASACDACPRGTTWNICRVQAPQVWPSSKGSGVAVAIIDTGIAAHPDLHIAGGINTIGGRSYRDDNGHGTHVAGIASGLGAHRRIPGVAPKTKLYAVKALDATGEGYISDIVEGIDWCIKHGIKVINMSFGLDGASSAALRDAVKRARRKGIVLVASAGNGGSGAGRLDEPASYPETIAVAASTIRNAIASYSSRGSGISVAAPGSAIKSAWPGGGYKKLSGTSMSSPHVAGGAALLLAANPRLRPSEVGRKLRSTARRLAGFSSLSQGSGLIRLARAFAADAASSSSAHRSVSRGSSNRRKH